MTRPVRHDPDRILEAFFEPGPRHLPEGLAAAIRDEVHGTRQRRGLPRWEGTIDRFAIPVAGFGVVAAVAVAVAILISGPSGNIGPGGSATPLASPPAAGSAAPSVSIAPYPSGELLAPMGYQGVGTIAYTRYDPALDDSVGWLISPDGRGESQLVVNAQDGSDGRVHPTCCLVFSPDGGQVAVGYMANGLPGYTGLAETRILTVDGNEVRWLPNCGACAMVEGINYLPRAWSPDGSLMALEVWSDSDETRRGMNIALVNDFGWAEQVGGNYHDVPVAFSPDSTRLLFVRTSDTGAGTLMVLTIPDLSDACCEYDKMRQIRGEYREVGAPGMVTSAESYYGAPASWSPDGRQIAFVATDPSSAAVGRIWVVDADGGNPVAIASTASIGDGVAWSPDGKWIAFDRETASGISDVFITRPDGSGEVNLTESFGPSMCCAHWSPDSSALLVSGTNGSRSLSYLFIVPIDGSPIAQVTSVPSNYHHVSWSPVSR